MSSVVYSGTGRWVRDTFSKDNHADFYPYIDHFCQTEAFSGTRRKLTIKCNSRWKVESEGEEREEVGEERGRRNEREKRQRWQAGKTDGREREEGREGRE